VSDSIGVSRTCDRGHTVSPVRRVPSDGCFEAVDVHNRSLSGGSDSPLRARRDPQADAQARGLRPAGGVTSVVVLWGAAAASVDSPKHHSELGVSVVSGRDLQAWLLRRSRDLLSDDEVLVWPLVAAVGVLEFLLS